MMKKCCRCKEEKDLHLFGKNNFNDDKIHHYCKECQNKIAKEYRENNKDKVNNTIKKYRNNINNKFKIFASTTINDHKRNGYTVNITKHELEKIAENTIRCIYCDVELNYNRGDKYKTMINSPSMDNIENKKTIYINDIRIICHRCNTIKNSMSHKEFIEYCKKIYLKFNDIGE